MEKNAPIGVLDSGVGGLTVLKYLHQFMPNERFIFVGDTARTPYGTRTESEIRGFVEEILSWLERQNVKMVVVACNTITMLGINTIKKDHKFLLMGMSKGEELLTAATRKSKVGVFATPFTISTGAHQKAIHEVSPEIQLFPMPCARFVPLIEGEKFGSQEVVDAVKTYAAPLKDIGIDALILSCTHYPFIKDEIEAEFGPNVKILDPAQETAMLAKKILEVMGLEKNDGEGNLTVCCTADVERMQRLAQRMELPENTQYKLINLQE